MFSVRIVYTLKHCESWLIVGFSVSNKLGEILFHTGIIPYHVNQSMMNVHALVICVYVLMLCKRIHCNKSRCESAAHHTL